MRLAAASLLAIVLLFAAGAAEAERTASVGMYAEGGIGATSFIGEARSYSRIGPAMSVRIGYDLFSWFSVGAYVAASTHEATVPPPPEGERYQLYSGLAEGRLGFRVGGFGAFACGGAGLAIISSNVLGRVGIVDPDEWYTVAFTAGGGLEYQLLNRHYAFGVDGVWTLLPQFAATQTVTAHAYLRYTY